MFMNAVWPSEPLVLAQVKELKHVEHQLWISLSRLQDPNSSDKISTILGNITTYGWISAAGPSQQGHTDCDPDS